MKNRIFICKECFSTECILAAQYNGTYCDPPTRCPYDPESFISNRAPYRPKWKEMKR